MNSLILLLFLGATVALAEIHVENDPGHHHHDHDHEEHTKQNLFEQSGAR